MVIRRDSLRAQTDFFSPMTGNTGTKIRYADAPVRKKDTYGSQVKERLSDIGKGTRRAAPIMEAIKVAVQKTEDPFTQIAEKKSYAPPEENDFMGALEGAAGAAQDALSEGVSKVQDVVRSTGRKAAQRRADQAYKRQQEREADLKAAKSARQNIRTDFQNRFRGVSDEVSGVRQQVKTYESNREKQRQLTQARLKGVESGLSNLGKDYKAQEQRAIDNMAKFRAGLTKDVDTKISEVKKMYGQGGLPLGTTAPRQVVKGMTTGVKDGVKVEAKPKVGINASTFQQKNVRGSGIPGKTGKDESARPKQVSNLPSNYKATEAKAFAKAKAFKGQQAAAKAASEGKTKAQQAAAARKATGTSISAAKAANRASMKAAAAARHASFKKAKAAGTHARTASAQRARNKAAAKARAKAAAKARNKKKKSKKGKKGGGCPDPMMLILMANGSQKRAGDLMVGDLIKTNHEKDMKSGEYKVEYVNVLNNREKAKFIFEESEIVCSLTHKFYVDNDWKEADDMVIGDEVSGQKLISIEDVEDGDVVHITVEDAHTYICQGLLSHNKRCDIKTKVDISDLTDMNLMRDDLADVAYFVRELREVDL